jgi:hypothetical protein
MTARLMKMSAVAETSFVEKTRKPSSPAAKPAAPRKRAPVKPAVPAEPVAPPEASTHPHVAAGRRRLALLWSVLIILAAGSTAAGFLFLRSGDQTGVGAPAAVSAAALTSFAGSHDGPVYWVGPMTARKLELTSNSDGTFVRYLPLSASIGDSARAITVGTYPMRNAYATAVGRAKTTQMTSRDAAGGGLAVWSKTRPTSVYLAFPGVPHLVEVYAPDADQARTLALSGRIRPVS